MKLLLRRDQRSGMLGKPVFSLDVRADISPEEQTTISKYRLGETMLYQSHEITGGSGLLGIASRLAWKAITINISVNDLAHGKRVEAKDVIELLAIEEHIREAAQTFAQVLNAAKHFGGEEVVELA
ncbi:MAG TPA: hypothetical protein VL358_06590 [Caulobacteraceae bacterium]|jgi:F420-0:gamma-glutamyl ligase-like protein|nr:hypothetical protein [Caulobacteraceae bacterium]